MNSLLASIVIALGVIFCRQLGWLQLWELGAYDWSIRHSRNLSTIDTPIVVITITENDIQKLGHWPLTDADLADVLRILLQYHPRAIGVDLYRDLPILPGTEELQTVVTSNPHIVMVIKASDDDAPRVPPPTWLKESEQVGFSDMLVDADGVVRRGLLFLGEQGRTLYSFALRLALLFLRVENIVPRPDVTTPEHLRLGPTTIRPLRANGGSYVGMDARGYQFLLDYKEAPESFLSLSLSTLLAEPIDQAMIQDKIVLIGVQARSVKDAFPTPYSYSQAPERDIPGVELHARIISQLLRFASGVSAPVSFLEDSEESFWILLWALGGGLIGALGLSLSQLLLATGVGVLLLCLAAYGAFLLGWWIPIVSPVLAWLFSAVIVRLVTGSRPTVLAPMPTLSLNDEHSVVVDIPHYVREAEGDEFVGKIVAAATDELQIITDGKYVSFSAAVEAQAVSAVVEALYLHLKNDYHLRYEYEVRHDVRAKEQVIRLPQHITRESRGTCIDLVLLFLGCLANAKVYPVYGQLLLKNAKGEPIAGHALAGVWLVEPYKKRLMLLSPELVRQSVEKGQLLVCDCTGFVEGYPSRQHKLSFEDAVGEAKRLLEEYEVQFVVDIRKAWEKGQDR